MTYIRPHLEYAIQAWSPHLQGDIDKLEAVQDRVTKTISTISHLSAEERRSALRITSLKDRRERGDLIQQFKFSIGQEVINWHCPQYAAPSLSVQGPAGAIRGHTKRLGGPTVKDCAVRRNFFTNRVVDPWNDLPQHVVDAPSVNCFKNRYDELP